MSQIGTMKITRPRVYNHTGHDVFVQPSDYPVYDEDGTVFWVMQGQSSATSEPEIRALGDGLYVLTPPVDTPTGEFFEFMSPTFDRADFESTDWTEDTNGALIYEATSC